MASDTTAARGAASQTEALPTRGQIRDVFLRHGFTVKDGQTDLKPYVYDAAYALLALAAPAAQEAEPAAHPDDRAVDRFAAAMKSKLAAARAKGRGGWETAECTQEMLSTMLHEHVEKGDPRDVANFCMFLWHRGESIVGAAPRLAPAAQEAEPVGYWVSFTDEPELELGHWFSEEPCGEGYLSLPLYAHPPRPQADAGADAPEGCTPADARMLRKANHDLAAESFELQAALRGIVDQAGKALARFDIAPQAPAAPNMESAALVSARHLLAADPAAHAGTVIKMIDVMLGQAAAAPTAAAGAYAPLPKPYSAAAALGLDDLYTGDDMRAYADAHRAAPAPAAGAQDMESVLIDGVAYQTPAPVAAELLRLHLEAMEAPAAGAAPSQHITQPYTVADIRERVASGDYSAELMLQHALLHLGAGAAPTDAEIDAVWKEGALRKDAEPSIRGQFRWAARAVLARWGAAAPAQEAEDGWMPIESAPNGERVLLGPRHAPVVGTVHRPEHWHEEQEPTATVVHYNGTTLVAGYRCSEWRRLPGVARARQEGGS